MSAPERLSPVMSSRRVLVLNFVTAYLARRGVSPSLREIAAGCGIGVKQVQRTLQRLERAGEIRRRRGEMRSISLVDRKSITVAEAVLRLRSEGWQVDEDVFDRRVTKSGLIGLPVIGHTAGRDDAGGSGNGADGG